MMRKNQPNYLNHGPYRVRYINDAKDAFTHGKEAVILDVRTATVVSIFPDPKGEEDVARDGLNAGWLMCNAEHGKQDPECQIAVPYQRAVLYNYSKAI